MNSLARILTAFMFIGLGATAFAQTPKKPAAPVSYDFRVGIDGKVVSFKVSGTNAFTFELPNGGKIVVGGANLHQQAGEVATKLINKAGGQADMNRHRAPVTYVNGATQVAGIAERCNRRPGSPLAVDFSNVGLEKLCAQ